ncbi:MAG: FlgD immunoglobulin-like domain containing protein [bacterium]
MIEADGGTAIFNPQYCDCEQPALALDGYETVSWEAPLWAVRVKMVNSGAAEARNVSVTMHEDIPWLVAPDAQCYYGTIGAGEYAWGGGDTYVFDLTDHPGGSFNAWFDVSYEDTCGQTHALRLDPGFDPDAEVAEEGGSSAAAFSEGMLGQNYPNPFNPVTTIPVTLRESADVRLSIFDSRGALVRLLAEDRMPPGLSEFVWDGRDANGGPVSSGIYFCRLATGTSIETRKLVLLK